MTIALNIPKADLDAYLKHIEKSFRDAAPKGAYIKIDYEVGSKYIRVVTTLADCEPHAHSFIVNRVTKEFPVGKILKANSWSQPARNFARGDVITKDFDQITWTGAL